MASFPTIPPTFQLDPKLHRGKRRVSQRDSMFQCFRVESIPKSIKTPKSPKGDLSPLEWDSTSSPLGVRGEKVEFK